MASHTMDVNIKIADIEAVKELLIVLAQDFDLLPERVQIAINAVAEDREKLQVYDNDYLMRRGYPSSEVRVYIDGVIRIGVIAGYPLTGRAVCWEAADSFPDSFWITSGGEFICGWGDKPLIEFEV